MIVILILVIMLLIAFVLIACKRSSEIYIDIICAVLIILSITGLVYCIPNIAIEQCDTEKKIHSKQIEYESLIKQCQIISSEYEDVSKANVIQNVYKWNKEVYDAKYWADNPLTNWFWNQRVVDSLKYIDLEDYGL